MVVKGGIFGASRERSKKVYIHSLDDSNTATRGMIIELISAFKEH
jgi:hypothetical protein